MRAASAACRSSRTQDRYETKISSRVEEMAEETAEEMDMLMCWSSGPSGAVAALLASSTAASAR